MAGPVVGMGIGALGIVVKLAIRRAAQMFMSPVGQKIVPSAATGTAGGLLGTQIISLGDIKNDVLQELAVANQILNPAEEDYIEEISRAAGHLIEDIGNGSVFWKTSRRTGEKIPPEYLMFNLTNGNAWITSRYYNSRSVNAAFKRGRASGHQRGRRDMAQTVTASK